MSDLHPDLVQRGLFLAAFGSYARPAEAWVADRLAMLLEEQRSEPGESLFSVGDWPEHYYFLRRGRVKLDRSGAAPRMCDGPSAFGISDALLGRPRMRSAVAVTEIEAMKVQCEAWIDLLEDSFPLARAAVMVAARTVADLEQRVWSAGANEWAPKAPLGHGSSFDVIDRLALLASTPLLRSAGVQTLSDLAAVSEVRAFAHGEVLVERGRPHDRVHLILEGEIDATREAPRVSWRGGPGDIVCGTAAFTDAMAPWQARARTSGYTLVFRTADWLDLMEAHFDMVRATLGALALAEESLTERLPAPET